MTLRFADKYGTSSALESCCRDAILAEKRSYTYVANTVSSYAEPKAESATEQHTRNQLKPICKDREGRASAVVSGIYKDDDDKYSLQNLLKRQKSGDLE